MLAWLQVLLQPVRYLYELFSENHATNLYILAHTGQVCYLQAVLNDLFDPVSRGIFISDGPYADPAFIYEAAESKPLFIDLVSEEGTAVIANPDPVPLYTVAETYLLGVQFIINVPVAVATGTDSDIYRLRATVDKFRVASKNNYSVVTY